MEFSKELIAKARACESETKKALADKNGIEKTDEEIKHFICEQWKM